MALAKRKLRIHISVGHTLTGLGTGSVGYINESNENRIVAKKVVALLKKEGHYVTYGEVNKSGSYLKDQVALANKEDYDVVVQIHFNATKELHVMSEIGTEVWYSSSKGKEHAERVVKSIGMLYKNRGAKPEPKFYWLKNTKAPAILIETCFVNSKGDTDKYIVNRDFTAKLIAEGIMGTKIVDVKPPVAPPKPVTAPVTPPNNTKKDLFQVVAGTYLEREYANQQIKKLHDKGIDAFIQIK